MSLKLDDYRQLINLDEKYIPNQASSSNEELLRLLENELDLKTKHALFSALKADYSKRDLIRAVLTIRPSGKVNPRMLALNDAILQEELKKKWITNADDLIKIKSRYPMADRVSLWDGDITTLKVDAIVNAANPQMEGCFIPFHKCIDNIIHNAAGIMLREDCGTIMRLQGAYEETGQAKITRGYNLPSRYVIHTVGPIVSGTLLSEKHKEDLRKTYRTCLDLAKESGLIKSIAFCSISTGVYGFPFEEAAKIALSAVNEWLEENPDHMDHVIFNTYGEAATQVYSRLIEKWR
ncbi:protein-ADP-ribose hydrolase [Acidaminobacter sp. JC074]|uniref:protein-ADP-ribose hydrolase n=1 Tax=Acidaminobacter sp. JC074 TaxID=2530199 RepID=UPI001F0E9A0E|nr:protein-ADP-ribose hydrolase [Acidaminobacter sp. JC074]MCH4889232.1 protein-ADP-ribose hydrolase [Acidaminobacter sp. JC074]